MTNDSQGGLRGDQGVQNGHGDDTRDPVPSSSQTLSLAAHALVKQWRETASLANDPDGYWGDPVVRTLRACADQLSALLAQAGAPQEKDQKEDLDTRVDERTTSPPEKSEVCICAALLLDDGRVIRGHRHDDCIGTYAKWRNAGQDIPPMTRQEQQGFVTSRGRFVDRTEGARLMRAACHYSQHTGLPFQHDLLFSEDLY